LFDANKISNLAGTFFPRSPCDEAIHSSFMRLDGLLRQGSQ
jgi:hypothetical protein